MHLVAGNCKQQKSNEKLQEWKEKPPANSFSLRAEAELKSDFPKKFNHQFRVQSNLIFSLC